MSRSWFDRLTTNGIGNADYCKVVLVFFIYGLAFFVMGFAVALEARRASGFALAASLKYLVAFALLHSLVEWTDMFLLILSNVALVGRGFIKGVVHARPFDKRSPQRVAYRDRTGPSTLLRTSFSTSSKNDGCERSPSALVDSRSCSQYSPTAERNFRYKANPVP